MSCFVFDFDGVLADTLEIMVDSFHKKLPFISKQRAKKMLLERSMKARPKTSFSFGLIKKYGKKSYQEAIKGLDLVFTERLQEIEKLDLSQNSAYILSHSYEDICRQILGDKAKLFKKIFGNETHQNKTLGLEEIMQIEGVPVEKKTEGCKQKNVYFFTDTLGDVLDALPVLNKENIYGCGWGFLPKSCFIGYLDEKNILSQSFLEAEPFRLAYKK
jgi:hypothetical protein